MSKRKNKATLFEVFDGSVNAPKWLKNGQNAEPQQPEPQKLNRPAEIDRPVEKTRVEDYQPTREHKIIITVGYQGVLVAVLSALVLLGLSFQLGRWSAGSGTVQAQPDAAADSPLLPGAVEAEKYDYDFAQAQAYERLPQDKLLFIQTGIASVEDAQQIQKYLWQAGIMVYVNVQNSDGSEYISVIDTAEVSGMDAKNLASYKARLAELGKDKSWKLKGSYSFADTIIQDR